MSSRDIDDQWSVAEVADYLGVKPRTVTAYLARGQMPPPDGQVGRTPWWKPETIKAWRPSWWAGAIPMPGGRRGAGA